MPLVGLLSDSHGRSRITCRAVDLLLSHGAVTLIHLGDIGGALVLDALLAVMPGRDQAVPVRVVFGNNDWDVPGLSRYARNVGITVDHPLGRIRVGERELMFTHGDDGKLMSQALAHKPAWLCHGHTHAMTDRRVGETRVINPGALCRATQYTVALLDTDADKLGFFPVVEGE